MNLIKTAHNDEMIPLKFHLSQNYPNPFKVETTIKYCIPYKTKITINVYNSNGILIERLLNKEIEAGTYEIKFIGNKHPEGIYYCQLKAENYTAIKKMLLMK